MYGLVNKAIEDLICNGFGEDVWEKIKQKASIEEELFISNDSYPDETTYRLVAAASEVLQLPTDTIYEVFGEHWVLQTARSGYGELLDATGRNLPEFLINLPNFHTRVMLIFPGLQPPRFECTDIQEDSLRLHYYSFRPGLTAFASGLLKGLGKMFNTPVDVTLDASREQGADHDVFLVRWNIPT